MAFGLHFSALFPNYYLANFNEISNQGSVYCSLVRNCWELLIIFSDSSSPFHSMFSIMLRKSYHFIHVLFVPSECCPYEQVENFILSRKTKDNI